MLGKSNEFFSQFEKWVNNLNLLNEQYCNIYSFNLVNFFKGKLFNQYVFEFQVLKYILDLIIKTKI